jgi:hypothetical protein
VADIIEFPTVGRPRPAADSAGSGKAGSDKIAAVRRALDRLTDAAAALRRSRHGLERQHDVLGTVKGLLQAQALQSQAIAALALSIESAIATEDLSTMIALQTELRGLMMSRAEPSDTAPPRTDAAD